MSKRIYVLSILSISLFLLSGCLYPAENKVQNQVPYPDQIQSVQQAVNQFRADTGVLPIKNRDMDTPIYQKYPIDFGKLVPRYMQHPPGNSFESGGVFQYVLINVEEEPEVKLIDLTMMSEVRELQGVVFQYMRRNDGRVPVEKSVARGLFKLDYDKLGLRDEPRVRSPYFDNSLTFLVDRNANVFIDYKMDINMALLKFEHEFEEGEDIRRILTDHSPIVPAFSVAYTISEDNEPIFLIE